METALLAISAPNCFRLLLGVLTLYGHSLVCYSTLTLHAFQTQFCVVRYGNPDQIRAPSQQLTKAIGLVRIYVQVRAVLDFKTRLQLAAGRDVASTATRNMYCKSSIIISNGRALSTARNTRPIWQQHQLPEVRLTVSLTQIQKFSIYTKN